MPRKPVEVNVEAVLNSLQVRAQRDKELALYIELAFADAVNQAQAERLNEVDTEEDDNE